MKKILPGIAAILVALLITGMFSTPVSAVTSGVYTYVLMPGGAVITGYTGTDAALVIPDTIDGNKVIEITSYAFNSEPNLISVVIPDGVTSIATNSFYDCPSFDQFVIGAGNSAYACQDGLLTNKANTNLLICPSGKTGSYTIPDTITSLNYSCFSECSKLTSIAMPASVTSIGKYSFLQCTGLTQINVAAGNPVYSSQDGVVFNKNKTTLLLYPNGKTGSYAISNTVKEIGANAFDDCQYLDNVTIPESVTTIREYAFSQCKKLTSILIPDSVTVMETGAFYGCTDVTSLTIGHGLTSISVWAFYCVRSLKSVTIPDNILSIGEKAFQGSYLVNIDLGKGVTSIGANAFETNLTMTSLTIPANVTSIGTNAFRNSTQLLDVSFLGNAPAMGTDVFVGAPAGMTINYKNTCTGYTNPWNGYATRSVSAFSTLTYMNIDGALWAKTSVSPTGGIVFPITPDLNTPITSVRFVGWNTKADGSGTMLTTATPITSDTTVYAKCTVSYGTCVQGHWSSATVPYNAPGSSLPVPTSYTPGLSFTGWNSKADGSGTNMTTAAHLTLGGSIYAQWIPATYTVLFKDYNGVTLKTQTVTYGNAATAPVTPSRTGYHFDKWSVSYGAVVSDLTVTAQYTINSYAVTFNSQGGSAISSVNANDNTKLTAPAVPSKTGYTFGGWYKDAAGTAAWNFATDVVTSNTTLFAKWVVVPAIYAVTFNSQGGSAVSAVNANDNTKLTAPAAPSKTGYTFGGWYVDAAGTAAWNFATDVVTSNTTLFAKWVSVPVTYAVTFNSQGGSAISSVNANINAKLAAPAVPSKTGYTLGGWYKDAASTVAWNFATDVVTSNTTLFAKWDVVPAIYAVTFNSQGGSAISSVNANSNAKLTAPAVPSKTGYTLGGWYKDADCSAAWSFATDVVTSNTTLFAKWVSVPAIYTVTFNSQDGSAVSPVNANDNTKITAPAVPSKTGCTFGGWYKDAAGTAAWNFATDVVTSNTTLFARWIVASVTYTTHVQDVGWQDSVVDGAISGTSAQSKRLEAIRISLNGITGGGIEYKTHVQDIGWMDWAADGDLSGTSAQSKRLEAIQIRLTGEAASLYDVYYCVHAQNIGWLDWAKNGGSSGTAGFGYRLEAIRIVLVPKGGVAPGEVTNSFVDFYAPKPAADTVSYKTHVQDIGWQSYVSNGEISGTSAQSKRLEAIQIKLENMAGGIEYRTHVQDYGWMDWAADDALSGTNAQSKRLEAIQIRLTGAAAEKYDIYYCVHAQNTGWLDWAKNGESSGTAGFGYRLEAIKILLVPKGGAAPGSTDRPFVQG